MYDSSPILLILNFFLKVLKVFICVDPNGELCLYLEGVAEGSDVESYVKDHPFGQPAITSSHPHWTFYSQLRENLHKKEN